MTANLTITYGALNLTATPYLVPYGTDTGAPENEAIPLGSFIQDGDIELSSRAGNRTITFDVLIEGANLTALATAEANLVAETEKVLNTLTVDPGDSAPTAVYDIFRGQVSLVRDDTYEIAGMRRYTITVRALPFPRSATKFTSIGVAPGGATTTSLDTCGATTGWSCTVDGVAGTVTNAVGPPTTNAVTASLSRIGTHVLKLQKTFAATTSTTNLLMVDWLAIPSGASLSAVGDGVQLPKFAESASPTSGYTRTWFKVAASSLAVTAFSLTVPSGGGTDSVTLVTRELRIDNVSVTNVVPISGTNRQQIRSLDVPGSARTQGSLAIESATAALGDTMVYVYPADATTTGYSPPLRQFRTSGNTVTADAAQVSGSTEPLSTVTSVFFDIPIGLFPAGSYLLMGRLATSGGGTPVIGYTGSTRVGGTALVVQTNGSATITTTTAYQTFVLGRMQLPTVDMDPGSAAVTVMRLAVFLASGTCTYDEFWLFNTTIGRLIRVDCGTGAGTVGGTSRRLFIEPATVTTPRPTVRVGHSADRSDSHYPDLTFPSWQFPEFKPSQANVLIVTPNATDATITLSGYARWHTNPAS